MKRNPPLLLTTYRALLLSQTDLQHQPFQIMSEHSQSRNSRQNLNPPAENRASSEATTSESSGRRPGKIRRFLGKVKNATKKISHSKDSRGRDSVLANVDCEGTSLMSITKHFRPPKRL
ncbi:hypothetical protein BDR03DRAFT_365197 [Suillus americanus]|nr:hypothetical protein BDR03DRAFT_365197 [Suillus americanus]